MATKPHVHSYTSMSLYDKCPRRFYEEKVLKMHPAQESEAMRFGNAVHKAIEDYVLGKPLGQIASTYKSTIDAALSKGTTYHPEVKLAVTKDWKTTGFFDNDAYIRGAADLIVTNETEIGYSFDWKTGSAKYASVTQLDLMNVMTFAKFPNLQAIKSGLIFLVNPSVKFCINERSKSERSIATWLAKADEIDSAIASGVLPEKPNNFCGNCPCNCPYKENNRAKRYNQY